MPPKKCNECSCKNHAVYAAGKEEGNKVIKIQGKKYKRKIIDYLTERKDIFPHSTYLCTACASHAEEQIDKEVKKHITIKDYFEEFESKIEDLNDDQLKRLAFSIGKTQSKRICTDIKNTNGLYKDDEFLKTFTPEDWLLQRNEVVLNFLKGISGQETTESILGNPKKSVAFVKCMEQIYYLNDLSFVAPLSFSQNLVTYFNTGSKNAVSINNASSPSGSYSTLTKWTREHSIAPLESPKECDVVTFFDNNQVIQRKWRVQANFKSTCSVITTLVHIASDPSVRLQVIEDLAPATWMKFDTKFKEETKEKMERNMEESNDVFRNYRNAFIEKKIQDIYAQQQKTDDMLEDFIDTSSTLAVQDADDITDRYTFVDSRHPSNIPSIKMGDPCYENPCSYDAVEKVFDHILEKTEVNINRKWTVVGCDALPYTLGSRIIENTYKCPTCEMEYMSLEEYDEHRNAFEHDLQKDINYCRKYNNILLIPGLGHYEINMTKALFRLLWDVALTDLGKLLGFNSIKAQTACQSATDHHKSWQIIQIFLHAMADELLVPFCRCCIEHQKSPSLDNYYKWLGQVVDPNYNFMREVVFTYCFALHLFRAGVRRNNSIAINASKSKFAPLFFGLNMPFYMETYIRDSFIRLQCPPEISAFIQNNESYSVTGNNTKGEGGDFILEGKNRQTKRLVPPGLPNEATWRNICRNVDRIGEIRKHTNEILNLSEEDDSYTYCVNISQEITEFRKIVRDKQYLSQPFVKRPLISLSGKTLDQDLENFSLKCAENCKDFICYITANDLSSRKKYNPIFITEKDRSDFLDISNKRKEDLIKMVENALVKIEEKKDSEIYISKWKKLKLKTKAVIINFYKELEEINGD